MVITDNSVIVSAVPKYPNIMAPNSEDYIKSEFERLNMKKSEIAELHMKIMTMEQELEIEEKEFRNKAELFDITYGTREIDEIHNSVCLGIVNPSDRRNK